MSTLNSELDFLEEGSKEKYLSRPNIDTRIRYLKRGGSVREVYGRPGLFRATSKLKLRLRTVREGLYYDKTFEVLEAASKPLMFLLRHFGEAKT
jgi:hypothetical protein